MAQDSRLNPANVLKGLVAAYGCWYVAPIAISNALAKVAPMPPAPEGLRFPDEAWNSLPVWKSTNCYDYAFNKHTGGMVEPKLTPAGLRKSVIDEIEAGALQHGMVKPGFDNGCHSTCPDDMHLVYYAVKFSPSALNTLQTTGSEGLEGLERLKFAYDVLSDFPDIHWFRQNDDGMWSHKLGFKQTPTDLDGQGNPITCPSEANRQFRVDWNVPPLKATYDYHLGGNYLCAPDLSGASSSRQH